MQIGDGFIVTHTVGRYHLLFQLDKGNFSNPVTSATPELLQVKVVPAPTQFICVASKAMEQVALRQRDRSPFPPFFQPLKDFLRETANPDQEDEYIVQFLTSDRLNQRTEDDKTLLLCFWG